MTTSGEEKNIKKVIHPCVSFSDEFRFEGSNKSFLDRRWENGWICGGGSSFLSFIDYLGADFTPPFLCTHVVSFFVRWCQMSSRPRGCSFWKATAVPVAVETIWSPGDEWPELCSSQVGQSSSSLSLKDITNPIPFLSCSRLFLPKSVSDTTHCGGRCYLLVMQ